MVPSKSAFERWLRAQPGFAGARIANVLPVDGGASNLTCRVTLREGGPPAVCLRVQRLRGIFEPYDVLREGRVLEALSRSLIPVPRVIGAEPDPSILGGPFIVLEWIDALHMGAAGPEASFPAFTAAVVAIHGLDWRALGLDFLGVPATPDDGVRAELDAVAARRRSFGCEGEPLLARAVHILRQSVPSDGTLALCQGDINVFNYLVRAREVVGVVDWEQARISDPRSDVGQLIALSNLKGAPFEDAGRASFVQAYEAASGRHLENMAFFRARWLFELAVIYHGWVAFNGFTPWYSWPEVSRLLAQALAELE